MYEAFAFFDETIPGRLERALVELERQSLELKSIVAQAGSSWNEYSDPFAGDDLLLDALQERFDEAMSDAQASVSELTAMPHCARV